MILFPRSAVARFLATCLAAALFAALPARAAGIADGYPVVHEFFPQADNFGALEGSPPAAPVYRGDKLLGYVFFTGDVVSIPAYSGKPINTIVGFDLDGRITGIRVVQHEEPILLVGVSDERLQRFVAQYRGKSVFDHIVIGAGGEGDVPIDTISGATITVMVENATVMQAVRKVAESRGLKPPPVPPASAFAVEKPSLPDTASAPAKAVPRANHPRVVVSAAPKRMPAAVQNLVTVAEEPIWVRVWHARAFRIAILAASLGLLTAVLFFQDWLARHPRLLVYVRDGFLVYTVVFIGWYALSQLSVVNVLTFAHSVMRGFQWESFLIDPMMFILWAYVAVTLLLWGRGVYCGWLCPYGAMQELVQQLARRLKVPQLEIPQAVHERLWALKYIILLVLFGVSLQSLGQAERYAEIEPFKTAVTLRFQREWGFVLYAAAFILVSAFNRKFYCKYLCPLGAALTIPAKFRIFDWLRRHRECGRPCQVCAVECEVQAIRKNGEINANECHYCLDCQVTCWNDRKCPPMVERRRRREKSVRARELVRGMESTLGPSGLEDIEVRVESGAGGCAGCRHNAD